MAVGCSDAPQGQVRITHARSVTESVYEEQTDLPPQKYNWRVKWKGWTLLGREEKAAVCINDVEIKQI